MPAGKSGLIPVAGGRLEQRGPKKKSAIWKGEEWSNVECPDIDF